MVKRRTQGAFTVFELLIVIVVIGILATIVIIAYRNIQTSAIEATLKDGLSKSTSKLGVYKASSGSEQYPPDLATVEVSSSVTTLSYNVSSDRQSYCISNTNGDRVYFATNENTIPEPGICDGTTGVSGSGNIAQDSAPSAPTVVASTSDLTFSWADISCLAGMTPSYRWTWQVVGGDSGEQAAWTSAHTQTVSGEGAQVTGTVYARCESGQNNSDEVSSNFDVTLPVLSAPTLGSINVAGDSSASWSGSGCPAGTSIQYQWHRDTAREAGGYNSYSSWGSSSSTSATIGYDDRVTYEVQARCTSGASSGATTSRTSSTFTRGIPTPGAPGWGQHVVSNNLTMWWYATGCSAGYPVYHMWVVRRSNGVVYFDTGNTTATSVRRPSLPVASWDSHLQAYCQGSYTTSGWSGDNVART